jgi:hypothetical protein
MARDESAKDEGRGSTRCYSHDWSNRGDSGKPNHTPKAYHHAQRRLGAARDMDDDPWLEVQHSCAGVPMDITVSTTLNDVSSHLY